MPIVLLRGPFRVGVRAPPREHGPPHVHVSKNDDEVVIDLTSMAGIPKVRRVRGMRAADIAKAYRLVEEHHDYMMACWRELHG